MFTHRPVVFVTIIFILGIVMESLFHVPAIWLMAGFGVSVILNRILTFWRMGATIFFVLAIGFLGAFDLMNWETMAQDHVLRASQSFYGRPVTVLGIISSDIQSRPLGRGQKTTFTIDIREVADSKASGKVLVVSFDPVDIRYGDEVLITGKLHRPFEYSSRGRLTYRSYLAQRKIYLMLTVKKGNVLFVRARERGNPVIAFALHCRQHLNKILEQYLSPSEAGLMQALITGERKDVPPHVREIFFRTGTVHILAVSGMNVAMVAWGVFLFLNLLPVSRFWQMILTMVLIAFYALMTGASAPVVRAAVMSMIFLLGFIVEREQDVVNSLFLAAFAILVFFPNQIFDVGFQLSFGSVLSILLVTPLILGPCGFSGLPENRILRGSVEAFAVSCAVMIGIGGLLVYYFQVMTPIALIANLPIIPLVGLATALGGGVLFFGMFMPFVGVFFAACLKVTINLLVLILYGFCQVPGGAFFIPSVSTEQIFTYYIILILVYVGACVFIRSRSQVWPGWQIGL
ncbi:MAG: ComEC family competence protein [Candidatus Omnitrophica bacterium]|nr:ComEC family competence protein [Candidatus Omnitrophota bacterium]